MSIDKNTGKFGIIFYDGSCGACCHFIGNNSRLLSACGFSSAALQEEWVAESTGIPLETLLTDIHLITPDEGVYRGADAYRYIFKKVWWLKPLYALTSLPLLRTFFDYSYKFIADRRRLISKICGLHHTL